MQDIVDYFCQSADRENKRVFLSLIKPIGGKVLDLGCGEGKFTVKIAQSAQAKEMFGIEISKKKADKAKRKNITVSTSDLNGKIDFQDNSFETITANQVIEHLCFTDRFISEIKRILKPKGQLVISTTNLAAPHFRLQLLLGQLPICLHPSRTQFGNPLKGEKNPVYGHKSVFTHRAFIEFLSYHGFIINHAQAVRLYPLPDLLSRPFLRLFPNLGVFSTVRATKK